MQLNACLLFNGGYLAIDPSSGRRDLQLFHIGNGIFLPCVSICA